MPVREAIRRLEEAGLAEREPHKGAVVKGLTLEELVHVYDVRRLLEGEAARLGTERITADDCERMQAEYDLMVAAINERRVVDLLDHDEALLTILYTASGNPVLVNMIRTLWQHCRAYKIVGAQGTLAADGGGLALALPEGPGRCRAQARRRRRALGVRCLPRQRDAAHQGAPGRTEARGERRRRRVLTRKGAVTSGHDRRVPAPSSRPERRPRAGPRRRARTGSPCCSSG